MGVPLPLCSCGVIPTSVYMAKNGASKGSVVSFLISTPQTGIDSIIATYGMLGWVFAIFRPVAALLMGIIGGTVIKFIDKDKQTEEKHFFRDAIKSNYVGDSCNNDDYTEGSCSLEADIKKLSLWGKLKEMARYSFKEFLDDISIQFIIGLFISGIIAYFVPEGFFTKYGINNGIIGMLIMIVVGIPMYVCATASIPIAVTLMLKGFSPGVAFVFLVTGPVTNAASFTIIINVLGKKIAFTYLAVISITAILFGLLLDKIFELLNINQMTMLMHIHNHETIFTYEIKLVIGIFFLILLLMSVYRKFLANIFNKKEIIMENNKSQRINIEGMSCNHCVENVRRAISQTNGVKHVDVNLNDKFAYVQGNFDMNEIIKAVSSIGYRVV